ncbi:MAG: acyl-CoA dehydratase activase-related protein [Promethearchaeota archaeon]
MSVISGIKSKETKKFRVGIPRALYYHKYFPFWVEMLKRMNCQLILSPETDANILQMGSEFLTPELCVPMKIYFGHVQYLLKNYPDLDYIFIPRYASLEKNHYSCPYFMALPDMIKYTLKPSVPILEWEVNAKKRTNIESALELGEKLGIGRTNSGEAFLFALNEFRRFGSFMKKKDNLYPKVIKRKYGKYLKKSKVQKRVETPQNSVNSTIPINLLILGHPYNLYEPLINHNLLEWLKGINVNIITIEQIPKDSFKNRITINHKFKNYFGNEEELLQAARYYLIDARDEIDAVIFLTSIACVPDALVRELMERNFNKINKPFLSVILDGRNGVPKNSENQADLSKHRMIKGVESFIENVRVDKKYRNGDSN